ncbi:hypothetical protein [Neisseria dumasiana]|uniref:hypothetical protein n=1 Tax=Neisseria dumasiana TaxID=1931275 RepID=UPI001FD1274C|nr:hypothetical protein [Neisseria dumasiana]UOO83960.1 hypothetical protein LVJ88_09770 [Neisseria dumasiana]
MKRFCTAFQPFKVSVAALFCTEKAPSGTLFPKSAVSALQKRFEQRLKRQF